MVTMLFPSHSMVRVMHGKDGLPVHEDRATAASSVVTGDLRAREPEGFPEGVGQGMAGLDLPAEGKLVGFPVDEKMDAPRKGRGWPVPGVLRPPDGASRFLFSSIVIHGLSPAFGWGRD